MSFSQIEAVMGDHRDSRAAQLSAGILAASALAVGAWALRRR
jgi:hypothetical protein